MNILINKNTDNLIIPECINFTELVKNSNTTLSLNLQSKIVDKLNETFNQQQQHWYVANLYMYMNYHPTNDFPINLEDVFKMIGFANKGNAMKTIKSNFIENEDYKIALFHTEKRKNEGGYNKETVMLNTDTFKNLCMIAKTERGKEIRKYYVKLENIYNEIIKEEIEEQKFLLEKEKENTQTIKDEQKIIIEKNKHNLLIEKLKNKKCVYMAKISENLIKIGSAINIEERQIGLKTTFNINSIYFLDAFECGDNFREIEQIILNEPSIRSNMYKNLINGHKSHEVIKLSSSFTYSHLYNKINDIIKNNNGLINLSSSQLLEHKNLDFQINRMNFIKDLVNKNFCLQDIKDLLTLRFPLTENKLTSEVPIESTQNDQIIYNQSLINTNSNYRKTKNIKKIIQLNTDLSVYKIYDTMIELQRQNPSFSSTQINKVIKTNKLYKNFRWVYENDDIRPTVETKSSSKPVPVLKLNYEKTQILESFATKKLLAKHLNINENSIKRYIDKHLPFNNCYYVLYTNCSNELIDNYKKQINTFVVKSAIKIKQINPISNQVVIFNSISDASKQYGINIQTLTRCIKNKILYKGSFWEYI
jgi:phage anti-repressor protein